jgi:hypothetical protein
MLIKSFQEAENRSAKQVLMDDYSRVTEPVANDLLRKAGVEPDAKASRLTGDQIEAVHRVILVSQASVPPANKLLKALGKREDKFIVAIQELGKNFTAALVDELCKRAGFDPQTPSKKVEMSNIERFSNALELLQVRILPPPATCVAPIGETLIVEGLKRRFKGEFFASHTRPPAVYRGNPFVVEVGIAWGGELAKDQSAEVLRFANRVPLLYQPRACATTEAVANVSWKSYAKDDRLNQRGAELPIGPLAVFVHLASVWVPFTNEAKEAIASYDEIIDEIRGALQECGRKLGTYLNAQNADKLQRERRSLFEKYIEEIAIAIGQITNLGTDRVRQDFLSAMSSFVSLDEPEPKAESLPPPAAEGTIDAAPEAAKPAAAAERALEPTPSAAPAKPVAKSEPSKPAPSAPVTEAVAAKPAAVESKPATSGGEWPPRPSASAIVAEAKPEGAAMKSWLDAEIEARIAAKKGGKEVPKPAASTTSAKSGSLSAPSSTAPPPEKSTAKSPVLQRSSAPASAAVAAPTPVAKTISAAAVAKSVAPAPVAKPVSAAPVAKSASAAEAKSAALVSKAAVSKPAVSAPTKSSAGSSVPTKSSATAPAPTMRAGKAVVPSGLASVVRASSASKSATSGKGASAPTATAKRGADKGAKAAKKGAKSAKPSKPAASVAKKKSGSSKGSTARRRR